MGKSRTRLATVMVGVLTGVIAGATGVLAWAAPTSVVGGQAEVGAVEGATSKSTPATTVSAKPKAPASKTKAPASRSTTSATKPATKAPPATATKTVTAPPTTVTATAPAGTATVTVRPTPSAPSDSEPHPTAEQPPSPDSGGGEDLDADVATAVEVVQDYWNDIFTGWDVTWIGPSLYNGDGFYDSVSGPSGPYCGEPAPPFNAFYCGRGVGNGFVAWDRQLMSAGYEIYGDAFPFLVVAHEWGHVAQERFIADGEAPAVLIQQELQADCLAGSTLAGAVKLGVLQLQAGDTDELIHSLEAMGDEHPWSGGKDHGSSAERIAWFQKGFGGDIESCLGNAPDN